MTIPIRVFTPHHPEGGCMVRGCIYPRPAHVLVEGGNTITEVRLCPEHMLTLAEEIEQWAKLRKEAQS